MVNFNTLKNSNFLTKEDVTPDVLVTIASCIQKNVAQDGQPVQMKYTLTFHEIEKPLVLNFINASMVAQISGQEDTDNWIGAKVVLWSDPTVMFAGNMVGGIRIRAARNQQPPQQQSQFTQNNNLAPQQNQAPVQNQQPPQQQNPQYDPNAGFGPNSDIPF